MNDADIFAPPSNAKTSAKGDDDIFAAPKEVKAEAAEPVREMSLTDRYFGRPMTPEQEKAARDVKERGFGTGWGLFAEDAGGAVTDALAKYSPGGAAIAGGLTNFAINAFPMLASGSTKQTVESTANAVRNATIRESRDAGYVIPPSVTGGGTFSKAVESIGGKAATGQEAAIRNQQVTNSLARKAAGLADDEPITEAALKAARDKFAEPYREIADLSPRAKQALEKLQDARLDVKDAWKQYNIMGGATNRKIAEAADSKVDVLERLLEREASAAGKSDLVERLRQARVAIAKNFDVERALNIGTGDVDAKVIGRMLDKRGVDGMTGELGVIGKFARAFGDFAREAPSGQSAPGVNKLTPYAAAALGLGGYGAGEQLGMGPWGAAAAFLPILSGPARALALSQLMQRGVPQATTGVSGSANPLAILLGTVKGQGETPVLDLTGEGALFKR